MTQTDSVSEALLLEANLIKRYRPRFNVRLKDDKSYPYIKVTLGDEFPRVERTRKLVNDGSRYFGPYASASSVDESMNLVRRLFPFRTCTIDIKDGVRALQRPCLLYHIKRCQGPCITAISKADYRADIEQVELFLEGRQETLVKALERRHAAAAERTDYERAAVLRDKIRAIERTMESQKMAAFARTELDLLGLARQDNQAAIQLFVIRDGKMIGRDVFLLDAARDATDDEVADRASSSSTTPGGLDPARGLRAGSRSPTPPISRRSSPSAVAARSTSASRSAARSASCWRSRRATPARRSRASRRAGWRTTARRWRRSRSWPRRSACPDRRSASSATTSATSRAASRSAAWSSSRTASRARASTAASGSRPSRAPNDFASHQEVLRRRFRSARAGEEGVEEARRWAMPDLVIVDGGKGQVSAAKDVLDELGLHDLPLAGLAKEREELFLPDRTDPIVLPATSPALYLVQRLRDEAHRFAITYHRDLRARRRGPLRVRRPARRRAEAQARAAQGLRLDQARARRAGRADRGGARDRSGARGPDQGDPRGLTRGTIRPDSEFFIIPSTCIATDGPYGHRNGPLDGPRRPKECRPMPLRSPS